MGSYLASGSGSLEVSMASAAEASTVIARWPEGLTIPEASVVSLQTRLVAISGEDALDAILCSSFHFPTGSELAQISADQFIHQEGTVGAAGWALSSSAVAGQIVLTFTGSLEAETLLYAEISSKARLT